MRMWRGKRHLWIWADLWWRGESWQSFMKHGSRFGSIANGITRFVPGEHGEDGDGPTPQDRVDGYRYELATATSLNVQGEIHYVSNLNGKIGLAYDFKNAIERGMHT